ncbi:MAG TPA: ABC transporter ATP-binding protein [Terriglobia bacterium]|nr:ABC transporter ATP-binding protein [Terriglobia bacterium]
MADSFHEEEVLGKAYDSRLMRRLLDYLRPYWLVVLAAVVATFFYGLLQAIPPYLMKVEVDRYLDPTGHPRIPGFLAHFLSANPLVGILQIAFALFLPTVILTFFLEFGQTFAMQLVGQKVMYDLRKQIFGHLQRLEMSFFDRNPVGRLVTRVTTDVDVLNDLFAAGVTAIFQDFFTLVSIIVVMLEMNGKLALLTFSVLPLIVLTTMTFRRAVRQSYRKIRVAIARINAYLQEHLTGMTVLQLFNREARSYEEFEKINRTHMEAYKDSILAYGLFYPAVEFLGVVAVAIILYLGGVMSLHGAVTVGTAIAFIQYSQRFFRPIQDLSDKYNILQAAMASSERIFKLLDAPVTITDPAHPVALLTAGETVGLPQPSLALESAVPGDGDGRAGSDLRSPISAASPVPLAAPRVEFRDVSFAYQGGHRVIENVSFAIEPGETVAIVGHTGAGKTTLTSLLLRFYEVQEGGVLLNGVDVRQLRLRDLRGHFGIVLQDPFLFSGTIATNIRMGTAWITDAEMREAARQVNILDFVESLPHGFDEPVKERGATLSTGQKQLLSFARALAHNPRILILDEATSSVDTETEYLIRAGLRRLIQDRTSLVIAHRLSTIQNASKIIVMHRGRVREVGTHQELLERRGIYFKLYQLQYKDQVWREEQPAQPTEDDAEASPAAEPAAPISDE